MSFLRAIFSDRNILNSLGAEARAEAKAAGVDVYSIVRQAPDSILTEHPDGSVDVDDAGQRPLKTFAGK
jgi:hypothetical protein